jgi:hypothetical protein
MNFYPSQYEWAGKEVSRGSIAVKGRNFFLLYSSTQTESEVNSAPSFKLPRLRMH